MSEIEMLRQSRTRLAFRADACAKELSLLKLLSRWRARRGFVYPESVSQYEKNSLAAEAEPAEERKAENA